MKKKNNLESINSINESLEQIKNKLEELDSKLTYINSFTPEHKNNKTTKMRADNIIDQYNNKMTNDFKKFWWYKDI
jgi:vacuolar-type H+-ATPase subunit I/STV1